MERDMFERFYYFLILEEMSRFLGISELIDRETAVRKYPLEVIKGVKRKKV